MVAASAASAMKYRRPLLAPTSLSFLLFPLKPLHSISLICRHENQGGRDKINSLFGREGEAARDFISDRSREENVSGEPKNPPMPREEKKEGEIGHNLIFFLFVRSLVPLEKGTVG